MIRERKRVEWLRKGLGLVIVGGVSGLGLE